MSLSIVVPVYNEGENINSFIDRIFFLMVLNLCFFFTNGPVDTTVGKAVGRRYQMMSERLTCYTNHSIRGALLSFCTEDPRNWTCIEGFWTCI